MFLLLVGLLFYGVSYSHQACTLPPDFWCDSPSIAIECTGSLKYCEQYRRTRLGKPTEIKLAFESGCPDSQRFFVDRMFPKVLNTSYVSKLVDFKAYPYGLAKRETAEKVSCHHGERECRGNRLLTCMESQLNDKKTQSEVFYCFMKMMHNKGLEPEHIMSACLNRLGTSSAIMQIISACSTGQRASMLQRIDESETRKILSQPRFVPFISINGHSKIDMQAYQMMMPEKLIAWKQGLEKIVPSTDVIDSHCPLPPEFWCMDGTTTNQCFHSSGCTRYLNAINGQPINLKIIYSDNGESRNYVLGYIKRNFLLNSAANRKQMQDKVIVELEPAASSTHPCGESTCQYQAVQQCVASHIKDIQTRNQMLLCLMESGGDMLESWANRCHTFKPQYKDIVTKCANSNEWKQEVAKRAHNQGSLKPEPKKSNPWIVLNGYSLSSVQNFSTLLHRFICLWYKGPNHNRQACFRCEYELTHCMG